MKLADILTNKFLRLFTPALIIFSIWFFFKDRFSSTDSRINKMQCETEKKVIQENLNGVVVKNYRDPNNRDVRTLKYLNGSDTLISKIFYYETSEFFEYLKSDDQIKKESGSLKFTMTRNGKDTTHILNYGCKE